MELIKPIYFKDKEVQGNAINGVNRISDYELSVEAGKIVQDILCVQKDRDLWRVYVKTLESRSKLLQEGFDVRNKHINVYDINPYSAGIKDPSEQVLKITVKGIPLSVDDEEIMKMLRQFDLNFTSDLKYEKIRHPETRKITEILNGNRFIYVSALPEGKFLPRTCTCAGLQCFIYHYGQPSNKRTPQCTNCWEVSHFRRDCPNQPRCKVCKEEGHSPGDEICNQFTEASPKVVSFAGAEDPLSNFFPCELKAFGVQHKSSEHAFQYVKAIRSGDIPRANAIQSASSALDAKRIGMISTSDSFESNKVALMSEIIEAKFEQVSDFREALRKEKKSTTFVEATYDDFWASGLDKDATNHTIPSAWPGQNKLGEILGNVLVSHSTDKVRKSQRSSSTPRITKNASQPDISSMLSELRAPGRRNNSGSRKNSQKKVSKPRIITTINMIVCEKQSFYWFPDLSVITSID